MPESQILILPIHGWKDGFEVHTLTSKLSNLGSNRDPAMNCYLGVLQAGRFISVFAVHQMVVKLSVPSASISWWTFKMPRCPL